MCAGSQANDQQACSGISKAGNRSAPVVLIPVSATFDFAYNLTVSDQARAQTAANDLAVQLREGVVLSVRQTRSVPLSGYWLAK